MKRALTGVIAGSAVLALLAQAGYAHAARKSGGARPPVQGWRSVPTDEHGRIRLIVSYETPLDRDRVADEVRGRGKGLVRRSFEHLSSHVIEVDPEDVETAVADLEADPSVRYVEPDLPDQEAQAQVLPWGVDRIEADVRHAAGSRGAGVRVAVIDTGIWRNPATGGVHPDLAAVYKGGWDFVNDDPYPWDDYGHGTHVAGILAAADNTIGVVGVAPGVSLYVLKALNSRGGGYTSDLIAALDWCIAHGIRVANYSAGTRTPSAALEEACLAARNAGIVVVASVGNDGAAVRYPAAYESVIAVGATDRLDAWYSAGNRGPQVDLAAPGVEILSTIIGGGYSEVWVGTSMAAPHVAGAAALLVGAGMSDPATVQAFLQATATDLGDPGRDDEFGHGLVNADGSLGDEPAILAPLTGEVVPAGSSLTIDWDPVAGAASYRVLFSMDGARTWQVLAASTVADELAWTAPVPPGNRAACHIQVAAYDGTGSVLGVTRAGPFTVEVLRIDSPAPNQALVSGQAMTVAWTVHRTIRPVSSIGVFLSKDDGRNWRRVATLGPTRTSLDRRAATTAVELTGRRYRVTLYDRAGRVVGAASVSFSVVPAGP